MPKVTFTANIQRHVPCPDAVVPGSTIRAVLDAVFVGNPRARSYVLDDRGALRKHMAIYLDGEIVHPVADASVIHVFQALSGG
jgi:molybdopterin synthase sulfur carrier subunit